MPSNTSLTKRRRVLRKQAAGQRRKHNDAKHGTPPFPVHPADYDATAADAKPSKA